MVAFSVSRGLGGLSHHCTNYLLALIKLCIVLQVSRETYSGKHCVTQCRGISTAPGAPQHLSLFLSFRLLILKQFQSLIKHLARLLFIAPLNPMSTSGAGVSVLLPVFEVCSCNLYSCNVYYLAKFSSLNRRTRRCKSVRFIMQLSFHTALYSVRVM